MTICRMCKAKITGVNNPVLFTAQNGSEKLICRTCAEHIGNIKNMISEKESHDSVAYLRHLCDTKKLTDPEVIDYLNENALMFEENKLTAVKTDAADILIIAVKIIKWVIALGFPLFGLVAGIFVVFGMQSSQMGIGILIAMGIIIGGGIIGFTFFSILTAFEDWLFYHGIAKQ